MRTFEQLNTNDLNKLNYNFKAYLNNHNHDGEILDVKAFYEKYWLRDYEHESEHPNQGRLF
jgi:hypothetical protein